MGSRVHLSPDLRFGLYVLLFNHIYYYDNGILSLDDQVTPRNFFFFCG